ncbi:MAG: methylcrotonoyl-CoA carboxylase, partial [Nitratireductor sp.]
MATLSSQISPAAESFRDNAKRMKALVAEIATMAAEVERGGPQAARERHTARGKLLPRE